MLRILLLCLPAACATSTPHPPIQNQNLATGTLPCDRPLEKGTGGVHGILVGKVSKQPVAGAKFIAIVNPHIMPPHPSTTSDSTGCYFLGSLPAAPGVEIGFYTDTSGGLEHVDIVEGQLRKLDLIIDDSETTQPQ